MSRTVLRDPDSALARAWGIWVFPSTVLVGAEGQVRSVVRRVVHGALDWNSAGAQRLIDNFLMAPARIEPYPRAPLPWVNLRPSARASAAP